MFLKKKNKKASTFRQYRHKAPVLSKSLAFDMTSKNKPNRYTVSMLTYSESYSLLGTCLIILDSQEHVKHKNIFCLAAV